MSFEFKTVAPDEPLINDPFFAWLDANVNRIDPGRDMELKLKYLNSLGFVKGEHFLSEHQFKTLSYVLETWLRMTPYFPPQELGDLFVPVSMHGARKFFLTGSYGTGYYVATPKLLQMVKDAGWIYDVTPQSTYFNLTNGKLFAEYQQIIGSRFLCLIKGEQA